MGETAQIAKVFIVLAVLFLVVGFLYPGSDASWNGFRNTLAGQTFPQFTNPFQQGGFNANVPIGQQTFYWQYPAYANTTEPHGCGNVTYYACVTDPGGPDFNGTYLSVRDFNGPLPDFNSTFLGTIDFGLRATGIDWTRFAGFGITIYCRWATGNATIRVEVLQQLSPTSQLILGSNAVGLCPTGTSTFQRLTLSNSTVPTPPSDANADMTLQIQLLNPVGNFDFQISTIVFSGYFTGNAQCTGNGFFGDVSCQLGNIFRPIVNAVGIFVGALIFIGAVIWFGLNLLYLVLIGIAGQFSFFFSLPNTPPIVQGILDAALLGALALIFITVAKVVRGSSSG